MAGSVAKTPATVLLHGESGVGKEVYARYIHTLSERAQEPFIAINCAAIPASLLESELFGHEKGAFSGALRTHQGVFERANRGTLLLDEISEMPIELQSKLLRVLQERTLVRVGGQKVIELDIRLIATTNRDLRKSVEEGSFRRDLYYRLNVFPLKIPSLRERPDDVPALVKHYLASLASVYQRDVPRISKAALEKLQEYRYPGNVRELVNIIQRALILSTGNDDIKAEHVMFDSSEVVEEGFRRHATKMISDIEEGNLVVEIGSESLTQVRRNLILETLRYFEGNQSKAAEVLGITTRTIRNKLKQYKDAGLDIDF